VEQEALEILERNRSKGLSEEDLDELREYETFGPISYYEFPNRVEIELADVQQGIREEIKINTGNGQKFWEVFEDVATGEYNLNQSIRKRYSKRTRGSGGNLLARDLEAFTNPKGEIKEHLIENVIELLDYKVDYFNSDEF
jgi:hypothetical protein